MIIALHLCVFKKVWKKHPVGSVFSVSHFLTLSRYPFRYYTRVPLELIRSSTLFLPPNSQTFKIETSFFAVIFTALFFSNIRNFSSPSTRGDSKISYMEGLRFDISPTVMPLQFRHSNFDGFQIEAFILNFSPRDVIYLIVVTENLGSKNQKSSFLDFFKVVFALFVNSLKIIFGP